MPPTHKAPSFSLNYLVDFSGTDRPRVLRALNRSGGTPVAALERLGVDPLAAEGGAFTARMAGSDTGGRNHFKEYERRVTRGLARGARTAREAAGGQGPSPREQRSMPGIFVGVGWSQVENVSSAEAPRLARYAARCGELVQGQISPARFHRLISSWAPFRGERFESDPSVVIAIIEARRAAGEDLFPYVGRRS